MYVLITARIKVPYSLLLDSSNYLDLLEIGEAMRRIPSLKDLGRLVCRRGLLVEDLSAY